MKDGKYRIDGIYNLLRDENKRNSYLKQIRDKKSTFEEILKEIIECVEKPKKPRKQISRLKSFLQLCF